MSYEVKTLSNYFKQECNADVVRLSELFKQAKTPFELAYFHLAPGNATITHHHDEQEAFICLKGRPTICLESIDPFFLNENEILFVEKNKTHQIVNNTDKPVIMIATWWYQKM